MPEALNLEEYPVRLDEKDQKRIIHAVREIVESYVSRGTYRSDLFNWLPTVRCGVFVTINKNGMLRGCIGFPEAYYPIGEALVKASIYAATEDPRFPPVNPGELKDLDYEVTILGKPVPVDPVNVSSELRIGKHGLIVERGYSRGLLLPQVAKEYHMTPLEFLEATCEKAGLSPDAWRMKGTRVYMFPGYSFSEPS
ncbi:MAG TPA: TIGR00296 family protein [Thermoplasmataceae archaeon]|nr:TIGR00296 family protein [Thermoplasmataceae archaeon]